MRQVQVMLRLSGEHVNHSCLLRSLPGSAGTSSSLTMLNFDQVTVAVLPSAVVRTQLSGRTRMIYVIGALSTFERGNVSLSQQSDPVNRKQSSLFWFCLSDSFYCFYCNSTMLPFSSELNLLCSVLWLTSDKTVSIIKL